MYREDKDIVIPMAELIVVCTTIVLTVAIIVGGWMYVSVH